MKRLSWRETCGLPWKEYCSKHADLTRVLVHTCVHECVGVYVFKSQGLAKKKQFNELLPPSEEVSKCTIPSDATVVTLCPAMSV